MPWLGANNRSYSPAGAGPAWFANATQSQWFGIAGTDTATLSAAGWTFAANVNPWTGMAYDTANYVVYGVGMGGHSDGADNSAVKLALNVASPGWVRVNTPSASADNADVFNGTGARGDGSRAADHNYNLVTFANGKVFLPAFGSMFGGAHGFTSSAVWYWDPSVATNGTLGYTYVQTALADADVNNFVESGCDYDPGTNKVFVFQENGPTVNVVSVLATSPFTVASHSCTVPGSNITNAVVFVPRLGIGLLLGTYFGDLSRFDPTNPGAGATTCIQANTNPVNNGNDPLIKSMGITFDPNANGGNGALYLYNGGTTIYRLAIPATAGGTYTWSSISVAGGASPAFITDGVNNTGAWKKFGCFPNFAGSNQTLLVYTNSATGFVYGLKMPVGGL